MTTILEEEYGGSSKAPHPYLHGNFAPVHRVYPLTPCIWTGTIPTELAGGQYVRNGGNPVTNEDLRRDAHWFDGDGMLSGVSFRRVSKETIQPEFVNQYILTDVFLSSTTTPSLRQPILPSIATLVNPASSLMTIILRISRTVLLIILSNLPGSQQVVKKISVANTAVLFHDGRALATCESGPPMRIALPNLDTVGWFDGKNANGEQIEEDIPGDGFGGAGMSSFMREWTTAHPRVDPITQELILFHSTFLAKPYIHYSIIPSSQRKRTQYSSPRLVNAGISGIGSPKMMHDFGVSLTSTIIMDLPLSLDPRNLARNESVVLYDPSQPSRFGVFPRWQPDAVRWFVTRPCCIFHTANTWDENFHNSISKTTETTAVNMLACRLTSAALVYSAGDIAAPVMKPLETPYLYDMEEEQCRLYYYRFSLNTLDPPNTITHQFALSSIPFEFPSIRESHSMAEARYIYGCSMSQGSFGAALGRAVKIDCLVKVDALSLIARAHLKPPKAITGCVDTRTVSEILDSHDPDDPIKIFRLPPNFYAQESRFVPRQDGISEDDGWILSYVFDERQLDEHGNAKDDANSELWVIGAKQMNEVVCKIQLPQRVPYGLHGHWFSEDAVLSQRPVETLRSVPSIGKQSEELKMTEGNVLLATWLAFRMWILGLLG